MQITTTINIKDFNTAKLILNNKDNSWEFIITEDKHFEFLSIGNHNNWTIAHELASKGYIFKNKQILTLKTKFNWTVAHEMANQGYKFKEPEILQLIDYLYQTVEDIMKRFGQPVMYNQNFNNPNEVVYDYNSNDFNLK